ncbi:MAG TPA: response regulator [Candidatus Obscuribacterales bacterium]
MKKILVIEDEETLRHYIIEAMKYLDFEVIGAENGVLGVQLAYKHKPDLIICDIMMPQLDGYGVLNALRREPKTATIPIIFLSAKADRSDIRQGMNLGAEDYLTKPFTIDELGQAVLAQLEKRLRNDKQYQKKLEDLRSNISRSLPHEMRTPLQGILSLSEIVIEQNKVMRADVRLQMLKEIYNSAQRLSRLIENSLLYAELEIIATDPVRIEELRNSQTDFVKSLITDIAILKAEQAGREADLQINIEDTSLPISEFNLQKIAVEIIDNAFKFSPVNTPVRIESTLGESTFILSVTNFGKGMTASEIASVGAYMQFDRQLYEQQGCGLGLQIAKRLVELHGGKLTIESIPSQQTKVQITLPNFKI